MMMMIKEEFRFFYIFVLVSVFTQVFFFISYYGTLYINWIQTKYYYGIKACLKVITCLTADTQITMSLLTVMKNSENALLLGVRKFWMSQRKFGLYFSNMAGLC